MHGSDDMELDIRCVRDILLYLERHTNVHYDEQERKYKTTPVGTAEMLENITEISDCTPDALVYTILQLHRGGMIYLNEPPGPGEPFYNLSVIDLTWQGREFLNTIKGETVWEKTKERAGKLGVASMQALVQIGSQVITDMLCAQGIG